MKIRKPFYIISKLDLNTTGHVAVISNPDTGKVWKLGKIAGHIHKKYRDIRRRLQRYGKCKKVKQIKDKESRIIKNLSSYQQDVYVHMSFRDKGAITNRVKLQAERERGYTAEDSKPKVVNRTSLVTVMKMKTHVYEAVVVT